MTSRGSRPFAASPAGRIAVAAVAAIAVVTVAGLIVLWPGDAEPQLSEGLTAETESAEVVSVSSEACPPPQTGDCETATVRLESGPDAGEEVQVLLGGGALQPEISPGDDVKLNRSEPPPAPPAGSGAEAPATAGPSYTLADFERSSPMLWLALAFCILVILFGRLRGALSLVGLALSLAVVLLFIVPAILDDRSPPAVALVGSLAVMLTTILLAHGWNAKSVAAVLGTTVSLFLVVGLAIVFTELAHLTGLASEEATIIGSSDSVHIDFQGLLVAGMVIGALGVLDDVTVTQASTVMAVRAADPAQSLRGVYRHSIEVGRDHVSATVNTLVLAYVGASLPVLLLFSSGQLGVLDAANTELVATEIVATLVGSIGLIAAVPVTTLLAAMLASGLSERTLRAEAAGGHRH